MQIRLSIRHWTAIAAAAAAALLWLAYQRHWKRPGPALMASFAPASTRVLVHIDVGALRDSGVLELVAGARVLEDSEYLRFVRASQFDYRRDLDGVMLAFGPDENLYLASGRFRWPAIRNYVGGHGGACDGPVCYLPAMQPRRFISLMPLRPNLLAIAVSPDRRAVRRLTEPGGRRNIKIPPEPVWVELFPAALQNPEDFPAGTHLFIKALQGSETVSLSFGASGSRYRARLRAVCAAEADAKVLLAQFERITDVLRKLIASRQQQPNPRDLSGVLTAGVFRREGREVFGEWPIERQFLESLSGGSQ
jgi:hypothetical protein